MLLETGESPTHQLVRVPRLLECLMLRVGGAAGSGRAPSCGLSCANGLLESRGSCTLPEKTLFTAYLTSGSWSSSTHKAGSEESQCLWTRQNMHVKEAKGEFHGVTLVKTISASFDLKN